MTLILAIDTSTDEASVAVSRDETPLSELSWVARGNHSRHLRQAGSDALTYSGVEVRQLDLIAVAIGPGSFNGLRVGISYGQGVSQALDIPIVGISTLDVLGFQAERPTGRTWAVIDAGRGEVYVAAYTGKEERWRRVVEPARLPVGEMAARLTQADTLVGPGAVMVAAVPGALVEPVALVSPVRGFRRAAFLAELGRRRAHAIGVDQRGAVKPLYLRPSSAEEKRDRPRE